MDVTTGYKLTEVGIIPEDWEVNSLGALTDKKRPISYGIVQTGPSIRNGVRCLRVIDVQDGRISKSDLITTSEAISDAYKRTMLKSGDLVMPLRGRVGDVASIDEELSGCNLTRGVALIAMRSPESSLFCKHFISSAATRSRLEQSMNGSALQECPIATLRSFKIALPRLTAELEAIAGALSDADTVIESLEQLLVKKRDIKQGAMQQLLTGRKRLPGFSGGWQIKRLGELADIHSGGTPSTTQPQFWDGEILWCTPTDITALNGLKYLSDTSRKISFQGLKVSSAEMIPANSIVMTSRATIGECAINTVPVTTNQGFKNFIPLEVVDVEYLYYLLLTQKQRFIGLCGGSTFLEIGKTQLAVFEIRMPPTKAEQTTIAAVLSDMDAEIVALESKLAKAREIKQGMMQELLTGRVRLV
jgi:type I restriction enzyme S subunit